MTCFEWVLHTPVKDNQPQIKCLLFTSLVYWDILSGITFNIPNKKKFQKSQIWNEERCRRKKPNPKTPQKKNPATAFLLIYEKPETHAVYENIKLVI